MAPPVVIQRFRFSGLFIARGDVESNCGWGNLRDNRWDFRYCAGSAIANIIANKLVLLEGRERE